MARRRELKNIASGLFGSFISRNNDVGGYWGIGKLCLHAQQQGTNSVHIDLIANSIAPPTPEFGKLVAGYYSMLQRHISTRSIPKQWVASAIIELDFKPPEPSGKQPPIVTWGSLFKLTVAITDDKGKDHTISGYSYCASHNPKKESKSAGKERF